MLQVFSEDERIQIQERRLLLPKWLKVDIEVLETQ